MPRMQQKAVTDLDTLARRDGCGCPPQVELCAHFEGQVVVLCSRDGLPQTAKVAHNHMWMFGVARRRSEPLWLCECGCGWQGWYTLPGNGFDDHDLALAAFEAACERLRAGALS